MPIVVMSRFLNRENEKKQRTSLTALYYKGYMQHVANWAF